MAEQSVVLMGCLIWPSMAAVSSRSTGRVTQSTLTDGRVISLTYDVNGNITSIKPPSRPKHEFGYTDLDQAASYTPPSLGAGNTATTYSYNLDKQVTKVTRPDGKTIDMIYDAGGRMSKHTIARGATSYSYNATTGNLQTITAPDGGTVSYSYDGSLPTSETWAGSVAGNVSYAYDKDFRVTSTSVNAANPIPYQYNDDSLLTQAGNLTLSRNAQNGMLTSTSLGGVGDTISYNSFGETTAYTATAGTSNIYGEQSTRNKLGLITQKRESIGNPNVYSYTYDSAGRLTQVWLSGVLSSTYTYDSNGNRLSATVGGSSVKGTYDDQDRMLTYGNMNYAYTTNGDLQSKTSGGQTTSYEYDELGNLLSVALPNGTKITYLIDGTGRRIGKKVNGTLTQGFLYSGPLAPIAELNGSGALVSRFVYATHANVPDYMIKGGVTYRILTDHLGSPRLVINTSNGTITQRLDYDEWGNITQDTNPGFQPFGFAGGLYDRDTGLVRFGARDYDPVTGRWTTKDPIGFNGGDTNLYGYVLGDPINWVDVEGKSTYYVDDLGTGHATVKSGSPYSENEQPIDDQGENRPFLFLENLVPSFGNWTGGSVSGRKYECRSRRGINPGGIGDVNVKPVNGFDSNSRLHDIETWVANHFEKGSTVYVKYDGVYHKFTSDSIMWSVNPRVVQRQIKWLVRVVQRRTKWFGIS